MTIKRQHNFSLVELLIVVAIIGILSSLVLPALGKTRHKARIATCLSNQKQIGLAIFLYTEDNLNHVPAHYTVNGNSITYDDFLGTGYDGRKLTKAEMWATYPGSPAPVYQCPTDESNKSNPDILRSYSMIQGVLKGNQPGKRGMVEEGSGRSMQLSQVSQTSQTIMLGEYHFWRNRLGRNSIGVFKIQDFQGDHIDGDLSWSHEKYKFNYLLADGSARGINYINTYLNTGKDPWSNTNTLDTMWDAQR